VALAGPSLPLQFKRACKPSQIRRLLDNFLSKRESIAYQNLGAVKAAGCRITGSGPGKETQATQAANLTILTRSTLRKITIAGSKMSRKSQRLTTGAMRTALTT